MSRRGIEDPLRLTVANALGQVHAARRLLKKVPDTGGMMNCLASIEKELGARLENMPLQAALDLAAGEKKPPTPPWLAVELAWRVGETWQKHVKAWRQWRHRQNGVTPNRDPFLHPQDIEEPIRKALLLHDAALLAPEDRETWKQASRVLAAGVGIFYDPWCTGDFEDGQRPQNYGGPYVEHWRPWKRLNGKPDPVIRFSERYFEARDVLEAGG